MTIKSIENIQFSNDMCSHACIHVEGSLSPKVTTRSGVPQGCSGSPTSLILLCTCF